MPFRKSVGCILCCLGFYLLQIGQLGTHQSAFVSSALHHRTWGCSLRVMRKEWHTAPEGLTIRIRESASASEVLERLSQERHNPLLDLINIGAAWVKLAKLKRSVVKEVENDPMMDEFIQLTQRLLKRCLFEDFQPCTRASANMFWAIATLRREGLLRKHLTRVQQNMCEAVMATSYFMEEIEVPMVIWSCAELKLPQATLQKVMSSMTDKLADVADRLSPEGASMVLLAAAKLGKRVPELLVEMPLMAEVLPERIRQMEVQPVSSSIWSIAKMPKEASTSLLPLIENFVEQAGHVKQNMTAQSIVNKQFGQLPCSKRLPQSCWSSFHVWSIIGVNQLPGIRQLFVVGCKAAAPCARN